jgi:hypothetical protein
MWNDFNEFELAQLAGEYGFQDLLQFNQDLSLQNRNEIESVLTKYEFDNAFSLDNNSEVEYN